MYISVLLICFVKQELKERIEKIKEKNCKNGEFASESEFSEEMMDIRRDLVSIHGEMVLLKNYSSLNFAGMIIFFSFRRAAPSTYSIC